MTEPNTAHHPYGHAGVLSRDGGVNTITFVRSLPSPPERVWQALTTEVGVTSWLAPTASIDGRPGGHIRMAFDEENIVSGTIIEWAPHTRFAHEWIINDETPSSVRYELAEDGAGTKLTLIHTGLPDEMCGGYTPGWHAYFVRLESSLAGDPLPDWMDVFQAVAPQY